MFSKLGELIIRVWPVVLLVWIGVVIAAAKMAPPLESVVQTEEFAFLPSTSPSHEAEALFKKAFPDSLVPSRIVIVVERLNGADGLSETDIDWIDDEVDKDDPDRHFELRERLIDLANEKEFGGLTQKLDEESDEEAAPAKPVAGVGSETVKPLVSQIRTYRDKTAGKYLRSPDGKAMLVLVELTTDFLDGRNIKFVEKVHALLHKDEAFRKKIPTGLEVSLSGEATVGRDMQRAAQDSAKATENLTVILVVVLLILIYRAPLLALIPLATVFVSVKLTMSLLKIMAEWHWVTLFSSVESYVTVLVYGAGVDYCLFLIARYKEELDEGVSYEEAVSNSLIKVGAAIAASAGTVICGIGMMIFAEFGKFRQAGVAISFGLTIVLLASLTFTPALLRLVGRWAFWPEMRSERVGTSGGWLPTASLWSKLSNLGGKRSIWESVGKVLLRHPLAVWLGSIAMMLPFAVVGVLFYTHLSYGLLSDLPPHSWSVRGTHAVRRHFAAGSTGPITVLLENAAIDFTKRGANNGDEEDGAKGTKINGFDMVMQLTKSLNDSKESLQLSNIRSVSHPLGATESIESLPPVRRKLTRDRAVQHYVSQKGDAAKHVTRLELTAEVDPFSRDSISHLTFLQQQIRSLLPADVREDTGILVSGSTASIRDLKSVTDRDQIRIDILVIVGVFAILVVLLRRPAICGYLMVTVLFSYLAALGATYAFYWMISPAPFAGLDWKVPMFLFTILIAVGEDYNIFLMTRIEEEQRLHGSVNGIIEALSKTGRIISSCGIIMAGTFASLAAGSLRGMSQLGFALAFGVMLDTFVVRPILVPAYLVLLQSGRFGPLSKFLGIESFPEPVITTEAAPPVPPAANDGKSTQGQLT